MTRFGIGGALIIVWLTLAAHNTSWSAQPGEESPITSGGNNAPIVEVTTLADAGEGSLRWAVSGSNRKVVFKVAGEIWLKSQIVIRGEHITVAGDTAPPPGISLMGDSLRIRGSDIIVRHLRVRVGDRPTGSRPGNRDGIGVDGSLDGTRPAHHIVVEQCSVSWAIDEGIEIWGENSHDIVIRSSIVAETLMNSIHPKGPHSMGLIVGTNTRNIVLQGNLFASNRWRNPAIASGASAVVVNNLIYNPGNAGLHFYADRSNRPSQVSVIGNVIAAGPDTKRTLRSFAQGIPPGSQLHYRDNRVAGTTALDPQEPIARDGKADFIDKPPVWLTWIKPIPSEQVSEHVLNNAGARPWDRDATDRRIVEEVRSGRGQIRDAPADPRLHGTTQEPGASDNAR